MDELVKDADVVICETKSSGAIALGYNKDNGVFKRLGPFLEVVEDWDEQDIEKVYVSIDGKYQAVPVSKFASYYKAIKSLVA